MSGTDWLQALALVLIVEGLMPFLSPTRWRQIMQQVLQLQDGHIRFFGLCCLLVGAVLLLWLA